MKIHITTLGCKVNQFETQAIETELKRRGHVVVREGEAADAVVVNTCTVTSTGDKTSRQAISRAKRLNPDALVAVCGCYAQTSPQEVRALGVDVLGGSGDRLGFISLLERAYLDKLPREGLDDAMSRRDFQRLAPGGLEGRTRAMMKVEDGCVNFCSYCIIPYARGPVRSQPLEEAVADAVALAAEGYRELVITGIEISSYGRDLPGRPSPVLLFSEICRAVPEVRVRLGSLEPRTVTEEFCREMSACPNLCPHFHLSLQSGCDDTLRRMNRKYDTDRFFRSVTLLRQFFPHPGITTDLITGFPGETEEEFSRTLEFVEKCAFTAMHVFPYSERHGTPAAAMEGSVPKAVRSERAARAIALGAKMEKSYLDSCVGLTLPVLYETGEDGAFTGHAPNYAGVRARGEGLHNMVLPTLITGAGDDFLIGKIV